MNWTDFPFFAIPSMLCWILSSLLLFSSPRRKKTAMTLSIAGLLIFAIFIAGYWVHAGRPPLTTTGETRLWYVFFLMLCSLGVYLSYGFRWVVGLGTLLACVFSLINIFQFGILTEPMMPILKSVWFVPHVIVYIFAYGILGIAFLLSVFQLTGWKKDHGEIHRNLSLQIDSLTRIGLGFLVTGVGLGAIWAKQAWGYFWTWDPKETWALVTILIYGTYLCLRESRHEIPSFNRRWVAVIQILGFIGLQMCWYGINYLKAAQGLSIHIYG